MRKWAHGQLIADKNSGAIQWNVIGDDLPVDVRDAASIFDAIATLGGDGWEMILFEHDLNAMTYWFKKRLDS